MYHPWWQHLLKNTFQSPRKSIGISSDAITASLFSVVSYCLWSSEIMSTYMVGRWNRKIREAIPTNVHSTGYDLPAMYGDLLLTLLDHTLCDQVIGGHYCNNSQCLMKMTWWHRKLRRVDAFSWTLKGIFWVDVVIALKHFIYASTTESKSSIHSGNNYNT